MNIMAINCFRNADFPVCAKAICKKRGALVCGKKKAKLQERPRIIMDAPVTEDPKQRKSEL